MSISSYFTKSVGVYHLTDETGDKRGYPASANLTTVGMLQPMGNEDEALSEAQFAKGFKLFTSMVDIRESDKVVIDSIEYRVKGVRRHDYSSEQHLEIFIFLPQG